ncbi:MAG: pitrilysin family protein [Alphaproteobacteria bacterium]|nr:pitrilysin family protein [Alphaproteobacteria bacterium]
MPSLSARRPFAAFGIAVLALLLYAAPVGAAVKVERVTSPGGIEAWLVQDPSNPIIALEMSFLGGAALDPSDKLGLAEMVSGLLDEGAGDLDSQAFQKKLEDLSIGLSFGAGYDGFTGSLKTLTRHRDTAFDLLGMALTAPRFDAEPVERIRAQMLTIIARNEKNPHRIAGRNWWKTMFPGHPYGRPRDGTRESIANITSADLKAFAATRLAKSNMFVAVVGDITPAQLAPLLDRTFGALPKDPQLADVSRAEPALTGEISVIRRPMPQSVVIFGQNGVRRDDPDWYAAFLMNYVLGGGGFTSRLTEEVREKRGLAYTVSSWLNPMEYAAVMGGRVGTENTRVGKSIKLIRAEWARMRNEGISEQELADAKRYVTGSFPLRLDSTDSIARILVAVQRHKLGIDYLDKRNDYINAVTRADVQRVAQRLLTPDKLTFVVVGEPANLVAPAKKDEG